MRIAIAVLTVLSSSVALQAGLVNRYSFTTDASDSVSSQNGVLQGTASISGGALQLTGNGYLSLPTGLVSGLNSFSIEAFITESSSSPNWSRIFDFGSGTSDYMFGSIDPGSTQWPWYAINSGSGETVTSDFSTNASFNTPHDFAITYDAVSQNAKVYLDGNLLKSGTVTVKPSDLGNTTHNYLGKSQFAADGNFIGSIDEFRIYNNALSGSTIAADAALGPNSLTPTPEPGSLALIGLGFMSLGLLKRRNR